VVELPDIVDGLEPMLAADDPTLLNWRQPGRGIIEGTQADFDIGIMEVEEP